MAAAVSAVCRFYIFQFFAACGNFIQGERAAGQWLDSLYAAIGDPMPVDRLEARLRKLAHFVEFAVLAMIMVNTFISWRVSNRVASGYILFLGLAVAVADEYIQLSVPGRTAQVTDIVLDFCGVFIIWLCREIWLWSKK